MKFTPEQIEAMHAALVEIRDCPTTSNSTPKAMAEALDAIDATARRGLGEEDDALDPNNTERAAWARVALDAHSAATGGDDEDAITDLLANLGHFCDANGISFAEQLMRACDHYHAESGKRLC